MFIFEILYYSINQILNNVVYFKRNYSKISNKKCFEITNFN